MASKNIGVSAVEDGMGEFFSNQKYPVIMLVLGVCLFVSGFYDVTYSKGLVVSHAGKTNYLFVMIGVVLAVGSALLFLLAEGAPAWIATPKVTKSHNYLSASVGGAVINVRFGRLEEVAGNDPGMVVLPANEFFDDECVYDKRSALGAYVGRRFLNQEKAVSAAISAELKQGIRGQTTV